MALARLNLVIQDEDGNIIDGASVTVQRESAGLPLAQLYSDRDGATPIGNPFTAADGAAAGFHVAGGAYKITATKDVFTRIWRYVAIGTAGEVDSTGFTPRGAYDSGSPGTEYRMLDVVTDQSSSWLYINQTPTTGNPPPTLPTETNDYWQLLAAGFSSEGREILTGDRTYYVRTDGSDSNDGLTDTSGGAFLTIQRAVNAAYDIDLNGHSVTIQVGAGTYTSAVTISGTLVGGFLALTGDTTTPSNVVISTTGANAISVTNGNITNIGGFKLTTTGSGNCLDIQRTSTVALTGKMEFGACAANHIGLQSNARITVGADYTISGNAVAHIFGNQTSIVACTNRTITISGTPAFSGGFINGATASVFALGNNTYSGSATGARYVLSTGAIIDAGGASPTYLPGNAAGTVAGSAFYFGTEKPAFKVNKGGTDQTGIADITATELTWSTESYDVGGYFASNVWTPPAGKISLKAGFLASGTWSAGALIAIFIYKNAGGLAQGNWYAPVANNGSALVAIETDANGTDTFSVRAYLDLSSGTGTVSGSASNTFFQGHWIGP